MPETRHSDSMLGKGEYRDRDEKTVVIVKTSLGVTECELARIVAFSAVKSVGKGLITTGFDGVDSDVSVANVVIMLKIL